MRQPLSLVPHGTDLDGKVLELSVGLKSRWSGDRNPLKGLHVRALSDEMDGYILADYSAIDVADANVYPSIYDRPPLFHSSFDGVEINGGDGRVKIAPTSSYWTVAMYVKPIGASNRKIFSTDSTPGASLNYSAGLWTLSATGGVTAYVNGAQWSAGSQPFPYHRLIIFNFTSSQSGPIYLGGNSTGPQTAANISVNRIYFLNGWTGAATRALNGTEIAQFDRDFYRKPSSGVPNEVAISSISDTIRTIPDKWTVISSS